VPLFQRKATKSAPVRQKDQRSGTFMFWLHDPQLLCGKLVYGADDNELLKSI